MSKFNEQTFFYVQALAKENLFRSIEGPNIGGLMPNKLDFSDKVFRFYRVDFEGHF